MAPGGGYVFLSAVHEGTQVCEWLASIGVTGILLKYRTPTRDEAAPHEKPVADAAQAIKLVRQKAAEWHLDPKRVGLLGFSAGGVTDDPQDVSFPTIAEAAGVTAPAIFFHGSTDSVVDPATSQLFKTGLEARGITHQRVIYDTTGFSTGDAHSIQNVPALNSDMLARWQAWLVARGVLP